MNKLILITIILQACEQSDLQGAQSKSSFSDGIHADSGTICVPNTYKGVLIDCTKEPHSVGGSSNFKNTYCSTGDVTLDKQIYTEICPSGSGCSIGSTHKDYTPEIAKDVCVKIDDEFYCMTFQYKQEVTLERCD